MGLHAWVQIVAACAINAISAFSSSKQDRSRPSARQLENEADRESEFKSTFLQARQREVRMLFPQRATRKAKALLEKVEPAYGTYWHVCGYNTRLLSHGRL